MELLRQDMCLDCIDSPQRAQRSPGSVRWQCKLMAPDTRRHIVRIADDFGIEPRRLRGSQFPTLGFRIRDDTWE